MFTIADFMTSDVLTLSPQDSLFDARKLMREHRIRHVPIVDADGTLLGLVSQRDVLAAAEPTTSSETSQEREEREQRVQLVGIMQTLLNTVEEHCSLRTAALRMQKHKHGCLPILRGRQLVGIITDTDYVAIAINLLEQLEEVEPVVDEVPEDEV